MELNDYQARAADTAVYPESGSGSYNAVSYSVLGLTNEAGEVAGKIKKVWRDDGGEFTPEKVTEIFKELGDVLWYLAQATTELGYTLSDVAQYNVDKLASRAARGVIGGSGDNR